MTFPNVIPKYTSFVHRTVLKYMNVDKLMIKWEKRRIDLSTFLAISEITVIVEERVVEKSKI